MTGEQGTTHGGGAMDGLIGIAMGNVAAAVVLAVVAAALARAWPSRPALAHGLWLLVLLKLVSPPLWSVPVPTIPGLESLTLAKPELAVAGVPEEPADVAVGSDARYETVDIRFVPVALAAIPEGFDEGGGVREILEAPAPFVEPLAIPRAVGGGVGTWPWRSLLLAAWAVGGVLYLGLAAVRARRFARLVDAAGPAHADWQDRAHVLAQRLGLNRAPEIRMVPGAVAPMLWAIGGPPRLLLPSGLWAQLGSEGRDALLVHELAHLRRRDHWVRLIELVVTAVHWWNPLAWWAKRSLREAEERCCDAWVVWALPKAGTAYASALLDAVDFLSVAPTPLPVLASGMGQFQHLNRRILMIMNGATSKTLGWAGRLGMLGVAALLLPMQAAPARTAADEAAQDKPADPGELEIRIRKEVEKAEAQAREFAEKARQQVENAREDAEKARAEVQVIAEKARAQAEKISVDSRVIAEKARADAEKAVEQMRRKFVEERIALVEEGDEKEEKVAEGKPSPEKAKAIAEARAELRKAEAQLEAAAEKLAKLEGGKPNIRTFRFEGPGKARAFVFGQGGAAGAGGPDAKVSGKVVIRRVDKDGKVEEEVLELPAGGEKREIKTKDGQTIILGGPEGARMRMIAPAAPKPPVPPAPLEAPKPPAAERLRVFARPVAPARVSEGGDQEKRIRELESKLDRVLKALEEIKEKGEQK